MEICSFCIKYVLIEGQMLTYIKFVIGTSLSVI